MNEILSIDKFQSACCCDTECSENSEAIKQPAVYSDVTKIVL